MQMINVHLVLFYLHWSSPAPKVRPCCLPLVHFWSCFLGQNLPNPLLSIVLQSTSAIRKLFTYIHAICHRKYYKSPENSKIGFSKNIRLTILKTLICQCFSRKAYLAQNLPRLLWISVLRKNKS